jgi:hypothetical protein
MPAILPGRPFCAAGVEVVGLSGLPSQAVRHGVMVEGYDTGMGLLVEAADALDMAGEACDDQEDASRFFALADRLRGYLAESRPTTTLGMPRIKSADNQLTEEGVIHRTGAFQQSHIRIIPQ